MGSVRAARCLEPALHQALRPKAATARRGMPELVSDALQAAMQQDAQDLAALTERADEPTIRHEEFPGDLG